MERREDVDGRPAIALRAVAKRYGEQVALAPLDLDIEEGEFFCLLGPSGCGKTTTLNLIGGFVTPSEGEIAIRGERVDRTPPHQRDVNTVFQSYALFPHMTVYDNVGFGLRMARVPREEAARRIPDALRMVGLEDRAGCMPAELSGGQQQRVAVARALVNRPAVLLLDEPFGALDLKLRQRLQLELSQLHRELGMTFVFVTHDQEEAMAMADRIAVMRDGRLEQVGTPDEIYRRPRSRFVADFIGESNFLPVRRRADGTVATRDGGAVPCVAGDGDWREATLMVRPECVRVAPGEHGEGIHGRVVQASFLGRETRIAVAVEEADAPLVCSVAGDERRVRALTPEAPVVVSWEAEDAVILDRRAEGTWSEGENDVAR